MRTTFVGFAAVALLLVAGCDKRKTENPGPVVQDEVEEVRDTNAPFTPPEIRRAYDSTNAASRSDSGASKQAAASAQAVLPPKADTAKAVVAPAAPPPPVEKAPAPAKVEAAAVTISPSAAPASLPEGVQKPGDAGEWVVQVGIHKSETGARAMVSKLGSNGIPAYVVQAAANAGLSGSYWRVRVGRFALRADAQKFGESVLKPAGYSFWVDRKANEAPAAGGTP